MTNSEANQDQRPDPFEARVRAAFQVLGEQVAVPSTPLGRSGAQDRATDQVRYGRRAVLVALLAVILISVTTVLAVAAGRTPTQLDTTVSNAPTTSTAFRSGPCPTPGTRPAHPTAEDRARMSAELDEADADIRQTGFAKYSAPAQDGTWICGWVRAGQKGIDGGGVVGSGGAEVVYDAPNGAVMGVTYMYLGYFPKAEVDQPGFDPRAMRLERYGCDPFETADCRPSTTVLGDH